MKSYCISAKCTEVKNSAGVKTWKARVEKKSLRGSLCCPDCGTKLVFAKRRMVRPDMRIAL